MDDMKSCWVIIPVFNRCELTRACLSMLEKSGVLDRYTVCVVDDASTDGTREMLEKDYPAVIRVEGNGSLFWGGGIALGMEKARDIGAEVYFWLNDDCLPEDGAIERLVSRVRETKGICGGVCYETDGVTPAYSGTLIKNGKLKHVRPGRSERMPVELLNGNMVAIHREVVSSMGLVDAKRFPHYGGDSIYGLEASRRGFVVEIDGASTGINPRGDYFTRFGDTRPASAIWKDITWKGSPNYLPSYWHALKSMFGWRAYYRWPAFLRRLWGYYRLARKRETAYER